MSATVKSGNTSDPTIWDSVPDLTTPAQVNHAIVCDSHVLSKRLDINMGGSLTFAPDGSGTWELQDASIVVMGSLTGSVGKILYHVSDDTKFLGNTAPPPDPTMPGFYPDTDFGLWCMSGGEVNLKGPKVTPWLNASPTATTGTALAFGAVSLPCISNSGATLAASPDGWKAGDRLVLASVDGRFSLATLTAIDSAPVDLTGELAAINQAVANLDKMPMQANIDAVSTELAKLSALLAAPPLPNNQIAFTADDSTFKADAISINGQTAFPKVGNLSRRFQIIAVDVKEGDPNHRAHTMCMHGGCWQTQYVEFRNLGPRNKLGRYPAHYHLLGDSGIACGCFVDGCSMWQDQSDPGSRFISVHGTNGIPVTNNVGFRSQGHGFFLENGSEINNTLTGNLSVNVNGPEELAALVKDQITETGAIYDPSVVLGTNPNPTDLALYLKLRGALLTTHYWLRSGNIISGNASCGGNAQTGFLMLNPRSTVVGLSSPLMTDCECFGGTKYAFWSGCTNQQLVRPHAFYATVSSIFDPIPNIPVVNYVKPTGLAITDPFLAYNGLATSPYQGQLYMDFYKGVTVSGGLLAGAIGFNMHYGSDIAFSGTKFRTGTLIAPTYWQLTANLDSCDVQAQNLCAAPYGFQADKPSGYMTITNSTGIVNGRSVNGKFGHGANPANVGTPEPVGAVRLTTP